MWGHYAQNHGGMALGFEIPEEDLTKISYTRERAKIEFDQKSGKIVDIENAYDRIIKTKSLDWKYEEEYRKIENIKESIKEGELNFYNFSDSMKLEEIIIGLRCETPKSAISQLLRGDLSHVKVSKAKMHFSEFKMIEDRSARTKKRAAPEDGPDVV